MCSSITVSTVTGDVTVRLPRDRGLNVQARSVSGRVLIDGKDYRRPSSGQTTVDLPSDGGTCFVSTTGVSGHLTVIRGSGVA